MGLFFFFFGIMAILGEWKDGICENHKAEILVSSKMGLNIGNLGKVVHLDQ